MTTKNHTAVPDILDEKLLRWARKVKTDASKLRARVEKRNEGTGTDYGTTWMKLEDVMNAVGRIEAIMAERVES